MAHNVEGSERNSTSAASIEEKVDVEKAREWSRLALGSAPLKRGSFLTDAPAIIADIIENFDDPNIDKDAVLLGACVCDFIPR